ncbi:MAG: hypothetical protein JSS87_10415 [Acidobacteria bacterium]|nr:hypothetical protein [Acidobacteriota bacterium]
MKKLNSKPEYDFRKGVRGKYYERAMAGTNLILIDPDLMEVFPDAKAVNSALRGLVDVAKRSVKRPVARVAASSAKVARASR